MKNFIKSTLLLGAVLLTGCFASNQPQTQQKVITVFPPDSLLIDPCKATKAGESLIELAQAYNKNNGCIGAYKLQMNKIRENKRKQEALYNAK